MNKTMKKILAVCCAAMSLGLFACGGGGGSDGGYADDGQLTIFRWDFASIDSARRQETPIYTALKDVTGGYDLKASTAGYGDWEAQINNMYNTQSLPDIFVNYTVDRPEMFNKWIRDGAVLPISDYVTKDNYPNIYNRLKEYSWLLERCDYLNNKWYFIPIEITQTHAMFVRQDWIESLNAKLDTILVSEGVISSTSQMTDSLRTQYEFKQPETLTEFYRLAKAFTIYDPDNNGKADTYGYTCSGDNMWWNNWVFEAYGGTYWGFVEKGNSMTASWVTEENKQAVAFLNKLYKEGIMDPDYTAMDDATKISNFCQGKTGIMVDNLYYNTYLQQLRSANRMTMEEAKAAMAVIAPPKGETGASGLRGNPGFWCGTSINGNISASERTAALKLLDFLLSEEGDEMFTYGVEGKHYKVENGEKVSLMGQDANGFNYTIWQKDTCSDIVSLVNWKYSYNPGFSSNYEYVNELLEKAQEYNYVDPVCYVQTEKYIEYEQTLGNNSVREFVSMIGTNYGGYNTSKIGTVNWDTIKTDESSFDNAWSTYTNKYLNSWGGAAMISEWSKEAVKYLNK